MMDETDSADRPFEDLVLAFVKELMQAARRQDRSVRATANDNFGLDGDRNLRIDALIGAVDCLRLLKRQPGFSFEMDFDVFAEALRIIWRNDACPPTDRNDRLWNCAIAALCALHDRMRKRRLRQMRPKALAITSE